MTELSRRSVLTGAVAATATVLGPLDGVSTARAAAPLAGKQVDPAYRYKVGSYEITVLSDGWQDIPVRDGMVRNANADEINAALEAANLPKGNFRSVYHPIVVNTGSKLVLIDTGNSTVRGPSMGHLPASMAAAGIEAKAIDVVLISHFHPDHINGIVASDGKSLQYPNAEIMVPEAEWAFWMDEAAMNRLPDGGIKNNHKNCFRVFAGLENKVTKYAWDKEVAPGITAFASTGHTPGHTSYIVASGNGRVLVQCDVTQRPELYVRNPHWQQGGDMDGPKAAETRRKLYDMAVAEKLLIQAFHYPFPAAGYVEKDGNGYRLTPLAWNPTL